MAELRFAFGKWDLHVDGASTIAPGALVLTAHEHAQIVAASEALYSASLRAQRRLHADPTLGAALGLDSVATKLAAARPPGPFVTRIDFFRTADGWQVSEFNDDCPGGYNEAVGLAALFADALPSGLEVAGDLPDALARLLGTGRLGLLFATGYAEDLQVVRLLASLAEANGATTVLGSPTNLGIEPGSLEPAAPPRAHGALVLGQPVDAVFRFFPAEWFRRLADPTPWLRLLEGGTPVTNPMSTAWTQSKAIFAWMAEHGDGRDRALMETLAPATVMLDPEGARQAREQQRDLVLKPAFGRMGGGVVVGDACSPQGWAKAVAGALRGRRTRPFVMQRRFRSVPVELAPGHPRTACIGAYVVDGAFAGYYSRLAAGPVVAYNATNILTVVARP